MLELHLIDNIPFFEVNGWLKDYYMSRIKQNFLTTDSGSVEVEVFKENPSSTISKRSKEILKVSVLNTLKLNENCDIMYILADKCYKEQDARQSYEIIKRILDYDFYYLQIVPLYCACLTELDKPGELYYLAHKLIASNPSLAIAWFAVGSYYFLIKKYDIARKYFQKANQLDKDFAASWIAFGHCFASQNESDQAMAAYRTAARLFPGCYIANLCIGMEYLRTNNLKTAMLSFQEALKIYDKDPAIYNEIGVIHYKSKLYQEAKAVFTKGLELCIDRDSTMYETLSKNLGHTYRKLG